jgi:hypothetical protein
MPVRPRCHPELTGNATHDFPAARAAEAKPGVFRRCHPPSFGQGKSGFIH